MDIQKLNKQSEYFVKVQFLLAKDQLWAAKGYLQMEEQLFVKAASEKPTIAAVQTNAKLSIVDEQKLKVIKGSDFIIKFDTENGSIYSLSYAGKQVHGKHLI